MEKEDLKITLDELNAIIPICAHEFCDKNVGENDKVMCCSIYLSECRRLRVWGKKNRQRTY